MAVVRSRPVSMLQVYHNRKTGDLCSFGNFLPIRLTNSEQLRRQRFVEQGDMSCRMGPAGCRRPGRPRQFLPGVVPLLVNISPGAGIKYIHYPILPIYRVKNPVIAESQPSTTIQ